jgi:hypothetical protein
MKITIDNLRGSGAVDYTTALDLTVAPKIERKINVPAVMKFALLPGAGGFVVPLPGARVVAIKAGGSALFTGYLTQAPECEHLGWGEQGVIYRYNVVAESDEVLLDQKALPNRAEFVGRTAGAALRQLAQDLLPGVFDTSAVQNVDTLAAYAVNPEKKFSFHAGEIALAARASYRAMNGALVLAPVGAVTYALNESDVNFSAAGLTLIKPNRTVNDVTAIGLDEPQAYVRDYFVGDGLNLRFYLSQKPFAQSKPALIDEQYVGPGLDPTTWVVNDPTTGVSVAAQTLLVAGGTGLDGHTTVAFIEQIELGGALEIQHGDVSFTGASEGVLGGLYAGAISASGCLAGFQITPSGSGSNIQALVSGVVTGTAMATTAGHRYVLTTFLYSREVYRAEETFHSSLHPAGSGWGGTSIAADVRLVLEIHDIDPSNPQTLVAPSTVIFDGVISNAPAFCTYALVDAVSIMQHCVYVCDTYFARGGTNRLAKRELQYTIGRVTFGWSTVPDSESDVPGFLSGVRAAVEYADCRELSRVGAGSGGGSEQRQRCQSPDGER